MKEWPKAKGTEVLRFSGEAEREAAIQRAATILRRGGLVVFPTETVYGLGADALNERAVRDIFTAKGRPADNPLIVHLADASQVHALAAEVTDRVWSLVKRFWPGPLTIILKRLPVVPDITTGGLDTVALRVPDHPLALELLRAAGCPVAAPSANISGRPSPTTAAHAIKDLAGRVDAVLDGGPCPIGVESTVLDLTAGIPKILRPGGLTVEELTEFLGVKPEYDPKPQATAKPLSPGMKYRHYAPRAPLYLIEGEPEKVRLRIEDMVELHRRRGLKVGILTTEDGQAHYAGTVVRCIGKRGVPASQAASLFCALRDLDEAGVDVILAEGYTEEGLGLAVMNRLRKAAGDRIILVDSSADNQQVN